MSVSSKWEWGLPPSLPETYLAGQLEALLEVKRACKVATPYIWWGAHSLYHQDLCLLTVSYIWIITYRFIPHQNLLTITFSFNCCHVVQITSSGWLSSLDTNKITRAKHDQVVIWSSYYGYLNFRSHQYAADNIAQIPLFRCEWFSVWVERHAVLTLFRDPLTVFIILLRINPTQIQN